MKKDSKELGKLIAGKLRAQLQAEGPDCPGVETLAAYVDQTLTRGERESLQPHLALCAHCQEQVAELVRRSEAEEPVKVVVLGPAPGRRIAWFRWAWAAPALVALVVAGLWYTGEFRSVLKQQEPTALQAPPAPEPSKAPEELKYAQAPSSPAGRKEVAKAQPEKKAKREAISGLAPAAAKPTMTYSGAAGAVAGTGVTAENLAAPAPGAIAPPSERAQLATTAPPAKREDEAAAAAHEDRLAARAEVPPPAAEAAPQAKREKAGQSATAVVGGTASKERETPGFLTRGVLAKKGMVSSPAGHWRVGRHGLIQKTDASGNWVTQASGVDADLFDITFATPSVGWAVGQAGTLLRTIDGGETWNKVPIPTRADLILVTASGDLTAQVVTRDGQALTTTDGGKSWNTSSHD
jgi:cytoskeletal protein RodZ